MKTINKILSKNYLPVKIFLDDLESIEKILIENNTDLRIQTDNYEFESIEELKNKLGNNKINKISIFAHNPYITVEFHKLGVRLYCGSDDIKSIGIFHKIDSILSSSLRRPSFIYSYYTIIFLNILIYGMPASLLGTHVLAHKLFGLFGAAFVVLILWSSYINLFKSAEIILSHRKNTQSFLVRNKDNIIVGFLLIVITTIVNAVINKYFPVVYELLNNFLKLS